MALDVTLHLGDLSFWVVINRIGLFFLVALSALLGARIGESERSKQLFRNSPREFAWEVFLVAAMALMFMERSMLSPWWAHVVVFCLIPLLAGAAWRKWLVKTPRRQPEPTKR